jgi:hypothetical protein
LALSTSPSRLRSHWRARCVRTCKYSNASTAKSNALCVHFILQQVEVYMMSIVEKMRSELRGILKDSVHDYPTKPRDKWLFDWPSQIILVVNQIYWWVLA